LGLTLGATFSWFEVRSVRVYCAQLVVGSRNAKIVTGAKNLNVFVGFILRFLSVSLVRGMWDARISTVKHADTAAEVIYSSPYTHQANVNSLS
jgi:hypothetical protein